MAMTIRHSRLLLLVAFAGSVLAGIIPIAIFSESATLRSNMAGINDAVAVARQAHEVAEKINLTITDFTAIALDISSEERSGILSETDKHISDFKQAVIRLRQRAKDWLGERRDNELSESTEALFHSWEEIRDQQGSALSDAEKTYHFLQLTDNARRARSLLVEVETRATSLAEMQTKHAFSRVGATSTNLIAVMVFGFLISGASTLGYFVP